MDFVLSVQDWESSDLMEKNLDHGGDLGGDAYLPEEVEEIMSRYAIVRFPKVVEKNVVSLPVVKRVVKFLIEEHNRFIYVRVFSKSFLCGVDNFLDERSDDVAHDICHQSVVRITNRDRTSPIWFVRAILWEKK